MQKIRNVSFSWIDQQRSATKVRITRDSSDKISLLNYIIARKPIQTGISLQIIKKKALKIKRVMLIALNKQTGGFFMKWVRIVLSSIHWTKYQFIPLGILIPIKIKKDDIYLDHNIFFQIHVSTGMFFDCLLDVFQFELWAFVPVVLDDKYDMTNAIKSVIADILWKYIPTTISSLVEFTLFILNGGVSRHYGRAVVIFYSYLHGQITEDTVHWKRSGAYSNPVRKLLFFFFWG